MWPISRPRSWYSASSLRVPRRTTAWRWAMPEMINATAATAASIETRSTRTLSSPTMPRSIACCSSTGTTTRPTAPIPASSHVTPRPCRSTGTSSSPRPIVCTADRRAGDVAKRPLGSMIRSVM